MWSKNTILKKVFYAKNILKTKKKQRKNFYSRKGQDVLISL